jgi:hypothetical protein
MVSPSDTGHRGIPLSPVFLGKRLQAIENKRRGLQKESQEISRGCMLLKRLELRLERFTRLARAIRGNTRKHSTTLRFCQSQNSKSKFSNGLRRQVGRNNKFKIRDLESHNACGTWLQMRDEEKRGGNGDGIFERGYIQVACP